MSNSEDRGNIVEFLPNGEFYFNLGVEAFQRNNIKKAKKYLERAIDLCKTDDELAFTLCQLAICYQHSGDYEYSIILLNQLLSSINKDFPEAFYFLANSYAFLEDFDHALEMITRYLEEDPNGDFRDEAEELLALVLSEPGDY